MRKPSRYVPDPRTPETEAAIARAEERARVRRMAKGCAACERTLLAGKRCAIHAGTR